ncbi:CehA/McbA family metallohydrolase [Butyrivibrio sp. VCB2006]|uniref:CehA/McbA family metallohydrolase n=1 Tax=Butyrivibrio sp. VCB2006 TaxID=1280679 RepID=UPI0003FCE0AA|nr:CehA/McbA family metallohydrolase [Butyrivibrio sp. VCB2006]
MKNRKRILALILTGFLSVTTAFQSTSAVAFATEGTEIATEAASVEASSETSVVTTDASDEASTEASVEETDEASKEDSIEKTPEVTDNASDGEVKTEPAKEEEKVEETTGEAEAEVVISTIKEVKEKASGEFTVKGVVVYANGKNVYIQDETGAICLYFTDKPSVAVGNLLTAKGTYQDYNGLLELSGATLVENDTTNTKDYGFTTFDSGEIATLVANHDDYECQRVILKNVTVGSKADIGKGKVTLTSGSSSILVYDKSNVTKAFGELEEGTTVNVTAVVSDYKGIQVILYSDDSHNMVEVVKPEEPEPTEAEVDDSVTMNVASFAGTDVSAFKDDLVIYADGTVANDGANKDHEVTAFKGGNQKAPVYSYKNGDNNISIIGSTGMKSGDYYQITVSGKGYGLYKLSFDMRGSNTGAKNWAVSYSTDGENFTAIGDKVALEGTSWKDDNTFEVPADVKHVDKIIFRVGPADDTSINGKTVATGGVNRFTDIKVTGSPVEASDITSSVNVEPAAGEIPYNTTLSMNCKTKESTIYYSVNGSEFAVYDDSNKPVLTQDMFVTASELDVTKKAVVTVYATCEGRSDSVKKDFVYTQAQVGTVKASPNGGAIRLSNAITLKTATEGAEILYSLDKGETWTVYTEPFKLTELPASVMAKATLDGYSESPVATFDYTLRVNEEYNIYFGQLHSHTAYSDGAGTADEAFNHAANEVENLDFLAVTDHSNSYDNDTSVTIADGSASSEWVEGHELADKYTTEDFVGLFGYEMTWSGGAPGHMNTFNTNGFMSRNMPGYESKSRTALQNYYAQLVNTPESLSMFNHPGTTFGDFYDFAYYSKANDQQITLIEVGNGEGAIGSSGYFPSYEYYTRALDKGWHVAPANNQDNHKGRWGDANTGRTVILADSLTRENIYDAIRNMRVYATEDNDLKIYYTLNGYEMGTVLDEVPSNVNIKVKTSDPTDSSVMTVEVVANGGYVVASQRVEESAAEVSFDLYPEKNYYYIRVTQADGNIAVTAPVWISSVEAVGISSLSTETALPVAGEELTLNASFFNNEPSDFDVKGIVYTANGEVIHVTDVTGDKAVLKAQSELTDSFTYLCDKAGKQTIQVELIGYLNGLEKHYTSSLDLVYVSDDMVTHVVVDGSHLNDYVTGYYGGNVGNFADIAASDYVKVDVVKDQITAETLANATVFVVSAPNKNTKYGEVKHFEDSFIELVKEYVAGGGNLIVCGLADYQDTADGQSSTEINKLLEAVGATTRINSDEVVDNDNNGGQEYRLYPAGFNRNCYLVKGVTDTQKYSAYSGCSVLVDEAAVAAGKAEVVVTGFDTTYTKDCKQFDAYYKEVPKGSVVFAAREELSSGSEVLVTGTVFLSNFEVKSELDYGGQEYYANRNILLNYLSNNRKDIKVSTIAEMRKGEPGDIFTVEGYVTAGTAVEGNKFFDTIYVQDETAGTTVFPIADAGIEIGTKVRLTGFVDGYQGDKEIQIYNYKVLDAEHKVIEPAKVTTKQAADYDALGGSLLKVEGKVTKVVTNTSGVDYFYVVDESGVEARVFIDGYILASDGNDTVNDDVKVGNTISAVGLSYYNPDGACLRVRDRAEIELVAAQEEVKATLVTKWGVTYLVTEDGEKLTGFHTVDGKDYYFNEKGAMVKSNWVTEDGKKYYVLADGTVAKDRVVNKWGTEYSFDADGVLQTGFFDRDGNTYYAKSNGAIVKQNWVKEDGKTYYALKDGNLAKNTIVTKWGTKYIFDENGVLQTGFFTFNGSRYYTKENGAVLTNSWVTVDGEKYYCKGDGTLAISETITKWGAKYSFDEEGHLIK